MEGDEAGVVDGFAVAISYFMHKRFRFVAVCCMVVASRSAWAGETTPDFSKFVPPPLHPGLVAAAQTNHIPLAGMDAPTNTDRLNVGDSVTALVSLCQKDLPPTQWLLHVIAIEPGPKDKAPKLAPPTVLYASTGQKMEFTSSPAWVAIRTLGPFADGVGKKKGPVARDEHTHCTLDQGFLALGMDQAAAAVIRMTRFKEQAGKTNWMFTISTEPPPPAKVREAKEFAELMHLTAEEQRAIGGACPAMMSYFSVVGETPHLEELMFKVVDLPTVWSVVGHLGVKTDLNIDSQHFAPADAAAWGVPTHPPVYYLPMEFRLNNRPGLRISLAVTTPKAPFLACGGIVGILAEKPSQQETYLTVRILSARFAKTAP